MYGCLTIVVDGWLDCLIVHGWMANWLDWLVSLLYSVCLDHKSRICIMYNPITQSQIKLLHIFPRLHLFFYDDLIVLTSDNSCFLNLLLIFDNLSDFHNLLRMIILVTYVTCQTDLAKHLTTHKK